MAQQESVLIFDTTLRDGEQALQASLTVKEKLQIALALERLGVDIMEVGFPVSSPGDFTSVQTIAQTIKNSTVCALARCVTGDIDAAIQALAPAVQPRVHIFLATSDLHIESKFRKNFDQVMTMAIDAITYARHRCDDIEFSCEDAGRTPIDNLCRIVEAAINAGARTINIPDTVGYTTPEQFAGIIQQLKQRVPNIDRAILSVHCHDDLGMSVANSLSAVQAGARQVEGTINGIGERAGNCALEEVIMALKTRADLFQLNTRINHQEIYRTSQLVSQLCHMPVPANKAVIGKNAFAHSSGIHQDGVIKNKQTYEIMTPETIGLPPIKLNLTSRSGRAAVKHRMQEMGYNDQDYDLDRLYQAFLQLADKKGQVFDYDLEALAFINNQYQEAEYYQIDYLNVQSNHHTLATATLTLRCGEQTYTEAATGNGPVDAVYQAINRISSYPIKLIDYTLTAKGTDPDALGQADIIAEYQNRHFHGIGLATDIIEASANAMIHVLNSVWRAEQVQKQRQLSQIV